MPPINWPDGVEHDGTAEFADRDEMPWQIVQEVMIFAAGTSL